MTSPYKIKQIAYVSGTLPDGVTTQLQNAKDLAVNRLLLPNSFSNIVGVGLGRKLVGGEVTDTRCVRIYVQSKRDVNDLTPSEVVPPAFLDIPTDVIEAGRLGRSGNHAQPRDDQEKAGRGPGSSIRLRTTQSNVNQGAAGTLGAIVMDGSTPYILSCNHVLNLNGRVGVDRSNGNGNIPTPVTEVVTPALSNSPTPIATPSKFFVPLAPGRNSVDCAVAPLSSTTLKTTSLNLRAGRLATANGSEYNKDASVPDPAVGEAQRGQRVRKDGAVTGLTWGTIVDVNADFYVEYSFGTFLFSNQIVIEGDDDNFAADGDSGSIVIDPEQKKALGMIYAESGKFAIACSLSDVFRLLTETAQAPNLRLARPDETLAQQQGFVQS